MNLNRRHLLAALALGSGASPARAADLPALVARLRASVCPVGTFGALDSPRFTFRGTGFVVGDGTLVATCWHVIHDASPSERPGLRSVAVQMPGADGSLSVREADVVQTDRPRDLALLRLRGRPGTPLALTEAAATPEGTDVALMGFPIGGALGFKHVTHRGIVAAVVASDLPTGNARRLNDGAVARLREGSFELLQLDATAYPGNSGGPLFELEQGRVVGVVNMVLLKGNRESAIGQPTGITYAVPARYLAELLARV